MGIASTSHFVVLLCSFCAIHCWGSSIQHLHRQAAEAAQGPGYDDPCRLVLCPRGTFCKNQELQCDQAQCARIGVCHAMKSFPDYCNLPLDVGSCDSFTASYVRPHTRWFYNRTSQRCEPFEYSGCGGNNNSYLTLSLCQTSCVRVGECYLKPEPGPCRGRFIRYSYDVRSGRCVPFVYGGCRGNENNFSTEDMCTRRCHIPRFENLDLELP